MMRWIAEQQKARKQGRDDSVQQSHPFHNTCTVEPWHIFLVLFMSQQQVYTDHMSNDYVLLLPALCPCVQVKPQLQ